MAYQWMQSFKAENQRKTVLLLILFPVVLFVVFRIVISLFYTNWYTDRFAEWFNTTLWIFPIVIVVLVAWGVISFYLQKDIMFGLSWAKPITRKENPEIYNIVENLCITKWIPMPKIAIMQEEWMNAFATWWKKDDSWVAFTSWLLKNLNKREIEAVAGHELTHLMNKDSLLMYVAYIFVGVVSIVGQYIIRLWASFTSSSLNKSSSNKSDESSSSGAWSWLYVLGMAFLILWYLFYPLIKLAISRKREYMADLWSVEITRDSESMISALRRISSNPTVTKSNEKISWFFIESPHRYIRLGANSTDIKKKTKTSIRDSHPSIDDRIEKLQQYSM